jgi:hypothetical protein
VDGFDKLLLDRLRKRLAVELLEREVDHAGGDFAAAARQRALEPQSGNVASDQKRALEFGKPQMPLANQADQAIGHDVADLVGERGDVDRFDEAVDDDEMQRAMVDQVLWRHDDAREQKTGFGIDPFQLWGRRIDLLYAERLMPQPADDDFGRRRELGERALELDVADQDAQGAVAAWDRDRGAIWQHDGWDIRRSRRAQTRRRQLARHLTRYRRLRMTRPRSDEHGNAHSDAQGCAEKTSQHRSRPNSNDFCTPG